MRHGHDETLLSFFSLLIVCTWCVYIWRYCSRNDQYAIMNGGSIRKTYTWYKRGLTIDGSQQTELIDGNLIATQRCLRANTSQLFASFQYIHLKQNLLWKSRRIWRTLMIIQVIVYFSILRIILQPQLIFKNTYFTATLLIKVGNAVRAYFYSTAFYP